MSMKFKDTIDGSISRNAATATKLATKRTINGTNFDGTDNITTANWGTARNIYIADSSATNTGAAVSVNGSGNATLKLPATIKATLTGNADTATTATKANQLTNARNIIIGNKTNSFNGTGNITYTVDDIGAAKGQFKTATTAATAQWYRIAETASGMNRVAGLFFIENTVSGKHSITTLSVGVNYGINPYIQQLSHSAYSTTGISKARIVYHTSWSGNYAYLEVYQAAATAATMNVRLIEGMGWTLIDPSTVGSIPSGYTNKAITLANNAIVSNLSGNASTATKLATGRDIIIGNQTNNFNGTGNITFTLSEMGAATSDHNHDSVYSKTGHTHNYAGSSSAGGAANSAVKLSTARSLTIGNKGKTFDGSADVSWTLAEIGAAESGHTHNYAGSSSAGGAANSVKTNLVIKLNGGSTEGTNLFTFNGATAKSINITPSSIGAAASSHGTHVTYASATPKANGTAAIGSSEKVAREDHVHPVQTTVSGNAGTASKWANPITLTIGNKGKTVDGSANVSWTLAEMGAAPVSHSAHAAYGTCSTAAATAEKAVTVADTNWTLKTGTIVMVKFTASNTAGSVKLNVNSTGAYPIWYNTSEYTGTGNKYTGVANRVITYMFNGTHWVWITGGIDDNTTYNNMSLGQGYGTCDTAEATVAKVGTLASYSLQKGGTVAIKFSYAVPASATLNINGKGAKSIYFRNTAITAGIIKAGDTVTFIYDGSYYQLLAIDRWQNDITSHTHNYAGSSSAGGVANSAAKLSSAKTLTIGNKGKTFDGSGNVSWTLAEIGASPLQKTVVSKTVSSGTLTLSTDRYQTATLASGNTIALPSVSAFTEINLFVKDCAISTINLPDNCKWRVDPNLESGDSFMFTFFYTGQEWLAEVKIYS